MAAPSGGKRVLFTASTRSHIMNFHLPYLRAFREKGWAVDVACGVSAEPIPGAERVVRLPFVKKITAPENFRAALTLRRLAREGNYTLICAQSALGGVFTRLAVLGLPGRPRLCFVAHGYLFDGETPLPRRLLMAAAERLTAPVTDLLLTMNAWDTAYAQKHRLGRRVEAIPGIGIDFARLDPPAGEDRAALRRALGIGEDRFAIFYAAEFIQRKAQARLIEAMALLPERALLLLAGDGVTLERCKAQVRELGLEDRVRFLGYVDRVGPWLRAADAAASASRLEGLPFNVLEAMYLGLPVAASAIKGHTDLIVPERTGLLYPFGDSAACAAALRRLMEDPALAASLGAAAKASVERYRLERVLPQVMGAYESLVQQK